MLSKEDALNTFIEHYIMYKNRLDQAINERDFDLVLLLTRKVRDMRVELEDTFGLDVDDLVKHSLIERRQRKADLEMTKRLNESIDPTYKLKDGETYGYKWSLFSIVDYTNRMS